MGRLDLGLDTSDGLNLKTSPVSVPSHQGKADHMKAVVVHESHWANTATIARVIAVEPEG
jgi:hypothetical protein